MRKQYILLANTVSLILFAKASITEMNLKCWTCWNLTYSHSSTWVYNQMQLCNLGIFCRCMVTGLILIGLNPWRALLCGVGFAFVFSPRKWLSELIIALLAYRKRWIEYLPTNTLSARWFIGMDFYQFTFWWADSLSCQTRRATHGIMAHSKCYNVAKVKHFP